MEIVLYIVFGIWSFVTILLWTVPGNIKISPLQEFVLGIIWPFIAASMLLSLIHDKLTEEKEE